MFPARENRIFKRIQTPTAKQDGGPLQSSGTKLDSTGGCSGHPVSKLCSWFGLVGWWEVGAGEQFGVGDLAEGGSVRPWRPTYHLMGVDSISAIHFNLCGRLRGVPVAFLMPSSARVANTHSCGLVVEKAARTPPRRPLRSKWMAEMDSTLSN